MEKDEVMERWAEYVEELYKDENRGVDDIIDMGQMENEVYTICSEEIEAVIRDLPKGKACGSDNVSAELLQCMGEKGIQIMTRLINKIYKSGYIPEDFREKIFVPVSKVSKAQECGDFRTMDFRKGKGIRDAIFQLRMISERITQMNREEEIQGKMKMKRKKIYLCFVNYQKAFDSVRDDKLAEEMVKAGYQIWEGD